MTVAERPRVLLVDDHEGMRRRAAAVLASGCTIVGAAHDGPSALRAAELLRPDVIVLDISMADMSGLEVAARLRRAGSNAVIVFLSIYADEEIVHAARLVGAAGFVLKPQLASDLLPATLAAIAGRRFASADVEDQNW